MLLMTLPTGDEVHRYKKSIVINFGGRRRVLSTTPHNGGFREDLTAVFNHDGTLGAGMAMTLRAPTYAEHMALVAADLGLPADTAAGLSTAAQMENLAIKTETHREISVSALVTGGVEVNGGRVGDPASWDELTVFQDSPGTIKSQGTINIILYLNIALSPGALTRALVTCTEAKTAALQELMAPSRYSRGLATGSGTDGTILVSNLDSPITLTEAGKHCKLGEMIGRAVKPAVREALFLQSGLCAEGQHDILRRLLRFGVTEDRLWQRAREAEGSVSAAPDGLRRARFAALVRHLARQDMPLVYTSLYVHLLDELLWGLISPAEACRAGAAVLELLGMGRCGLDEGAPPAGAEDCADTLVEALETGLAMLLREAEEAARGERP
ncbi:MAG: adenosylcobinamide amidohydrolase [Spirochaetaceae bacterium]|jgi:adenosylcobinamide amidohydrolase|nr:adenosylcobinamide amidohydrolase [Spirochaetaceae bacterium]